MQSPRVLVTGAAGFIGRATTSELRARGVECIPTDLHPHPAVPDVIVGDLLNERFVNNLLQTSCSAVIHLSGILPTAARQNPLAATRANIEASCKLIEKTHKAGIGRFVFGSSLGVYGGRLGSQCISEDMPAAPEEVYGAGKLYVENVGSLLQADQFAFSALRIATTIGQGVINSASPWRSQIFEVLGAEQESIVEVPYTDIAIVPLVHVDDVARALVHFAIVDPPPRGIFNSPAESLSIAELRALIESINPLAKLKAGTRGATGIPAYLSCAKLQALGYEPVPLRKHFEAAGNRSAISSLRT